MKMDKSDEDKFFEIIHPYHPYYIACKGFLKDDYQKYLEKKKKCITPADEKYVYEILVQQTLERYKRWRTQMNL
jgi:hypothetical protein